VALQGLCGLKVDTDVFVFVQQLLEAVQRFGTTNWVKVAEYMPGRTSAQCRERSVPTAIIAEHHLLMIVLPFSLFSAPFFIAALRGGDWFYFILQPIQNTYTVHKSVLFKSKTT